MVQDQKLPCVREVLKLTFLLYTANLGLKRRPDCKVCEMEKEA